MGPSLLARQLPPNAMIPTIRLERVKLYQVHISEVLLRQILPQTVPEMDPDYLRSQHLLKLQLHPKRKSLDAA